jgi:hypothetical protein
MAYATKYRLEFDSKFGRKIKLDIQEDAFGGSITALQGYGETPLTIEYNNGEFDKLTGIRESKINFSIVCDNTITASLFLTTSDTQFKVLVYVNGTLEWSGWLDNDRLQEQFIDTLRPIELSANDGLALLKNKELSNLSDAQIWGIDSIKNYIAYCLDKTDLGLDYWSFINMYPVLESGGSLFDVDQRGVSADFDVFYYANITSFTFLTGPRTFDDCYTVLSKIMESFGCTLYQAQGIWCIIQTNDRIAGDLDGTGRNSSGTATATALNQSWVVPIGLRQDTKLINADALISWERPFKEVKMLYEFKMPPVYFRNWDLLDGTPNIPLSGIGRGVYDILHWTENTGQTYTASEYDIQTSAELLRYMYWPVGTELSTATVSTAYKVSTTPYVVNEKDHMSFSVSASEKNSGFGGSVGSVYIVIELTTSTGYYYLRNDGKWYYFASPTDFTIRFPWDINADRRIWKDLYIETVQPFPMNGTLRLYFYSAGHSRTSSNEVRLKDFNINIRNYFKEKITVSGYEQKSDQTNVLKNVYENQMFISNSDNVSTQGAVIKSNYGTFAGFKYYSAAKETLVPFAKYITRSYWRSVYRNCKRMEATVLNLLSSGRLLSPLNTVTFDEIPDREFMITTMRSDLRNETSEMTFVELRDTSSTDDFTELGNETFKYLNVTQEVFNEIAEDKKPLDWKFGLSGIFVQLLKRRARRRFNNYS